MIIGENDIPCLNDRLNAEFNILPEFDINFKLNLKGQKPPCIITIKREFDDQDISTLKQQQSDLIVYMSSHTKKPSEQTHQIKHKNVSIFLSFHTLFQEEKISYNDVKFNKPDEFKYDNLYLSICSEIACKLIITCSFKQGKLHLTSLLSRIIRDLIILTQKSISDKKVPELAKREKVQSNIRHSRLVNIFRQQSILTAW